MPDDVRPISYQLELEIVPAKTTFSGHAHIELEVLRPVRSIYLHAKGLTTTKIAVTEQAAASSAVRSATLRPQGEGGLIELELAEVLPAGHAALDIDYGASFDTHLHGLYRVEHAGQPYVFSQFEAISARQAFPCFDEPRFKTPFSIRLRVPSGLIAVSNTTLSSTKPLPDGLNELEFATTAKLPTYLVAFAVGPLDVASAPAAALRGAVPLRALAPAGRAGDLAFLLAQAPASVAAIEDYTGIPYPYEKLDLIAVPDFAAGAMENAGAITFRDSLVLVGKDAPEGQRRAAISVSAHEIAHMWFGDLVTMPWWDDIWLNEAFATWMSGHVVARLHPEFHSEEGRVLSVDRAMGLDSMASARQIRQPIQSEHDIDNAFDGITYVKGGAVLDTFESYLGTERFRAGIHHYLEAHRFGSATAGDLLEALEHSAQTPVAAAFSTFLDQPGLPRVAVELHCDGSRAPRVHLAQSRYLPLGSKASHDEHWQIPVCLRYGRTEGGAQTQCLLLQEAELELPLETSACPSFVLPNADARGYYRWSLGAREFDALLAHLGDLSVGEQLSALSNADAAARAGELSIDRLFELGRRLSSSPERELMSAALGVVTSARDPLLGDADLPAYRSLLRSFVQERARALGVLPKHGSAEDGETKLLRPLLFGALALEARDPATLHELSRFGRARLGLGHDAHAAELPSELVTVTLAAAVREGGREVVERGVSALSETNDGLERARLLDGLGYNIDPELTPRLLGLILDPLALRSNELLDLLFAQTSERETRPVAYRWLLDHFDAVVTRLGKDNAGTLPALSRGACNAAEAEQVRTFFTPRVAALMGGPRNLEQSLEHIELCSAFAARHAMDARAYLAARAKE